MKWSDIPASAKMTVASVTVIMSAVAWMTTFQTDAEAAEMEQRISKELKNIRVDEIEAHIDNLEFQRIKANPEEKEWIDRKVEKLEKKKECVQKGQC